ncbi:MAG: nickel pincer cofactor biosynthesis protein LarB [Oligoflexia bacterium]|nr:nickel pincer cofactor biosynthesis protein LarB [Oligoflexia bacterium]
MNHEDLKNLLQKYKNNNISLDETLNELKYLPFKKLPHAFVDTHRELRNGFPEVIYCPGKSIEQIIDIIKTLHNSNQNILATRCSKEIFLEVSKHFDRVEYFDQARIIFIDVVNKNSPRTQSKSESQYDKKILVMSAGTADTPVVEEAAVTARSFGFNVDVLYDVGVAGIHRLFQQINIIKQADIIIVVAGMEGALASVVAGLVDVPVIAVPTSVGYGANFSGITPLLSMLSSCAGGIAVVNIDNGFGAAYLACTIIRSFSNKITNNNITKDTITREIKDEFDKSNKEKSFIL